MTTTSTQSWREIVEKADDKETRHKDSLYPEVYYFSNGKTKRDSGPSGGVYAGDT